MKRWLVGSALLVALAACASDPEPAAAPVAKQRVVGVAPTEAELAMYRQQLSRILSHTAGANKATAADTNVGPTSLDGYGNVALVKITAEGNLATSCVDDAEEAIRFLSDVRTGNGGLEEK
jgi:hypothetical protein